MSDLLIVDDEPGVRMLVARWAEACGYSVSHATCAGEALDQMAADPADVALCDVCMPDRDGFWLAAQLRQQFPQTAVVMLTGMAEEDLAGVLERDAMGHLPKPFGKRQLLDVLVRAREWHLDRSSAADWRAEGT